MAATDILQQIGESLGSSATVKAVFGEPVHAAGRTVIPVARVAYGFGGGFGTGHGKTESDKAGTERAAAEGAESARIPRARSKSRKRARASSLFPTCD